MHNGHLYAAHVINDLEAFKSEVQQFVRLLRPVDRVRVIAIATGSGTSRAATAAVARYVPAFSPVASMQSVPMTASSSAATDDWRGSTTSHAEPRAESA